MSMTDHQSQNRENKEAMLKRLADALDCSPKEFFGEAPNKLSQAAELLRLWFAIEDVHDRAKALVLLRNMSGGKVAPGETKAPASGEPIALAHAMQKPE